MSAAANLSTSDGPLTQEHRDELELASARAKKIRKAARLASFNGWATGIFAALSAPFALFSIAGFLIFLSLSVVAYNEFRGSKRLLQFNPSSCSLLGWNQLGLLTLVIAYCVWRLVVGFTSPSPFAAALKSNHELKSVLGSVDDFDDLYKLLIAAVYGTVIVVSIIVQGLNALYYFTRRKHVEAYLQETPEWVLDLQRTTTGA